MECADDVLEELGQLQRASERISRPSTSLSWGLSLECERLLQLIDYDITPMDMLLLRSGLTTAEVSSMILVLELNGYIQSVAGGYIRLAKN